MLVHNIPPLFDENSKVLILGSFPSPRSREAGFFYGHPQNRFWKVLAAVFEEETPRSIEDKKRFLHSHHIALWDVIERCEITGADDNSIKNATPNDFSLIKANIKATFTTGKTATDLYEKFTGGRSIYLPSPSPANRAVKFDNMVAAYAEIKKYI